jgi:hypothetical protein
MNIQRPYGSLHLWREKGRMRVGRKQLTPTAIKRLTSIVSPWLRGEAAFAEIE